MLRDQLIFFSNVCLLGVNISLYEVFHIEFALSLTIMVPADNSLILHSIESANSVMHYTMSGLDIFLFQARCIRWLGVTGGLWSG